MLNRDICMLNTDISEIKMFFFQKQISLINFKIKISVF